MIASAFIVLMGLSGNAFAAEDAHAYNGGYCKAYYASQTNLFSTGIHGIQNVGNGSLYIFCPVHVDSVPNVNGTTQVWLYWTAANAGDVLRCTLTSHHPANTTVQQHTNSRVGTGWLWLDVNQDDFWGNSTIYCYLPKRGILRTIWFGEQS